MFRNDLWDNQPASNAVTPSPCRPWQHCVQCGVATFRRQWPDSYLHHHRPGHLTSSATVNATVTNAVAVAVNDAKTRRETAAPTHRRAGQRLRCDKAVTAGLTVTAVTQGAHGTVAFTAGNVGYTPNANYFGPDSFTYTATDPTGLTSTATVGVTVTNVSHAPTAANDSKTMAEDSGVNIIDVLANDFDVDNHPASNAGLTVTAVTQGTKGTVSFTASNVRYTPAANYYGTDSFIYTITDPTGLTTTATVNVTVTIERRRRAVAVANDAKTVVEDSGGNGIDVLANDFDVDNQPVSNAGLTVTAVGAASHGSTAFTSGGVTYTPAANYYGPDSFTYTATDPTGLTSSATVNVTVTNVNDAPAAVNDTKTVSEDSGANGIDVLANDFDVDNQPVNNAGLAVMAVTQGAHGSVSFTAGNVSYTPSANYFGPDSFTYIVTDPTGLSSTATVNVTVANVADAPSAVNDAKTVSEDSGANLIDVLANDFDVDNQPVSNAGLTITAVTQGANGSVAITAGKVSYTPSANYYGPDSFTYTVTDPTGLTSTATVNVTVANVADAPAAANDAKTVAEDSGANVIDVLANDFDVDNQPVSNAGLTVTAVSQGAHGGVSLVGGVVRYTPSLNYNGPDSFTYTITDPTGLTTTATVNVTVTPVNDAPVAAPDSYSVNQGATLTVNAPGVLVNDTDVDGDPLTAVVATKPANGSLVLNPNGSFTYTPAPGFSGADSISYKATDATATSAPVTVSISVTPTTTQAGISGRSVLDVTGNGLSADDTPLGGTTIKLYRDANGDGICKRRRCLPRVNSLRERLRRLRLRQSRAGGLPFAEVVPAGYA